MITYEKTRNARRNDPDGYDRMTLRSPHNARPAAYAIVMDGAVVGEIDHVLGRYRVELRDPDGKVSRVAYRKTLVEAKRFVESNA